MIFVESKITYFSSTTLTQGTMRLKSAIVVHRDEAGTQAGHLLVAVERIWVSSGGGLESQYECGDEKAVT
jgi:hypothetical protein